MAGWLRRSAAVAKVESLQLVRDRAALVLIFLLPIVQLLLYGYAISLQPRHVVLAVATNEPQLVDNALDAIDQTPILKLLKPVGETGSAQRAVEQGRAQVGVEVGRDPKTHGVAVRIVADAGDPASVDPAIAVLSSGIWRNVAETYAEDQAPVLSTQWLQRPAGGPDAWMIAPGLIGMVVMITMLFLGAVTLVREREQGSWESLLATPVRPSEALVGKLAPYLVVGLIQTVMMLGLVHALFAVPLPPATVGLVGASLIFIGAYLILGFAISTVTRTQLQSVQAAVFCYLPSLMLSGFMFPFSGMPPWAQAIGEALPLTHYIRATRDVLLRGRPVSAIGPDLWPILVFTAIAAVVAVACYRRRLD